MIDGMRAMVVSTLPEQVEYLDSILYDRAGGTLKSLPADVYERIDPEHLIAWCCFNAIYVLPTTELIAWLRNQIGNEPAMEIGAGKSCLGRHLGIRMVDNKSQEWDYVRQHCKNTRQQWIEYPGDVELMSANVAYQKYRPRVIIGGYITPLGTPAIQPSSPFGPMEREWLREGVKYIHVGNIATHGKKYINNEFKHRILAPKWLKTRAFEPELNRIWVYNG